LIASKRFLRCLNFLWYQKNQDKGVIVSGKYNPLSGANPVLAFLKETFGALWFKL
jgi:hypothetical protein